MSAIKLNELKDRIYKNACEHGFHDEKHSLPHLMMLVITEISEAVNAYRVNNYADRLMFEQNLCGPSLNPEYHWRSCFDVFIKDTVEDELADAAMRLLDMAALHSFDIDSSEFTDENMMKLAKQSFEGKTFTEQLYLFIHIIPSGANLKVLLYMLFAIACYNHIDLLWHIEQKMKYNEMRPYKHGKKC